MPSVETSIWMALRNRVAAVAGAVPLAWPGDGYTPGAAAYLSVASPSLPPMRLLIGHDKAHRYSSILPLVLRSPLAGLVYEVQLEAAAKIAAAFTECRPLRFGAVRVRITNRPEMPSAYRDGGWFHQPINVPFDATA